jgi:hypothetical protein
VAVAFAAPAEEKKKDDLQTAAGGFGKYFKVKSGEEKGLMNC